MFASQITMMIMFLKFTGPGLKSFKVAQNDKKNHRSSASRISSNDMDNSANTSLNDANY